MVRFTARLLSLFVFLAALAGPAQAAPVPPAAPANTITVNSTGDPPPPGKCGLRDAIAAANSHTAVHDCPAGAPGPDIINFSLGVICRVIQCKILLADALPVVSEALTINGGGVEISGQDLHKVFDLGPVTVNLTDLIIANGQDNLGGIGGAIHMAGTTLTVSHVHFLDNQAKFNGGAIDETSGTLFVYNSVFSGNHSLLGGAIAQVGGSASISESVFTANTSDSGGAIALINISSLRVTSSTFDGNSASVWGGALYLQDDPVQAVISQTTFTNNQSLTSTAFYGGAAIWLTHGTLTLSSSTLATNTSESEAGALEVNGGQATLTNVTLSANSAKRSGGALSIRNDGLSHPATVTLNNVTITSNTADSDNNANGNGGGIFALDGTLNFQNSIIAGNFDTPGNLGAGTVHPDCSGTFTAPSYTLIGRNDGCLGFVNGINGNLVGTGASPLDPLLGALANNGGPTLTHALLSGSPTVNAGNPLAPGTGGLACAAADQRGVPRPLGPVCDLGAYETGVRVFLSLVQR